MSRVGVPQPTAAKRSPRRAALVLIAAAALLVSMRSAAMAESCSEAATRLAHDNSLLASQSLGQEEQPMSGSSMPPATIESRGAEPDARSSAPSVPMREASPPKLSMEERSHLSALLEEAKRADEEGRRQDCEAQLRRAQALLPPG
jgi:hypothetical protein